MDLPKMLFVEPTFKTQFGAEHAAAVDIGGAWIFEGRAEAVREAVTRYNAHEALVADKARLVEALRVFAQVADVLDFYVPEVCPDEISFPVQSARFVDCDGPGRVILSREDFMRARAALDAAKGGA